MFKIAILIWIVLGTSLAGAFVLVALTVPDLAAKAMQNVPYAAAAGFALAVPLAYAIARRIAAGAQPAG